MRNNGYKKLSSHGSISIPVALRRDIGIQGGDPMEVSLKGGEIMIRPYIPRCVFCGETESVATLSGKGICSKCAQKALNMKREGQ